MSRRGRAVAVAAAGLLASAVGLVLAFGRVRWEGGVHVEARVRWADLRAALYTAHVGWLAAFAALNLATLPVRGLQLRALARRSDGAPPKVSACYHAIAVGMLAQNVLPARLGEAARVVTLARAGRVAPASATAAVVLGRVLDLLALLAVTSLPSLWIGLPGFARAAEAGAVAGALLIAAVVVLHRKRAEVRAWAARRGTRIGRAMSGFTDGLAALGSRRRLAGAALASLAAPALSAASLDCALRAFDLGALPAGAALALTAAIYLAVAVPSAPSSLGVYHAAVTWLLAVLGADPTRAAAFAVATHAASTISFLAAGAWSLARVGSPRAR